MKLTIALIATLTGTTAFVPSRPASHHHVAKSSTTAVFSSMGFDFDTTQEQEDKLKAKEQAIEYLEYPSPVVQRTNLGTNVLISGFDPRDPSAAMVLDFLNNEDSKHLPFTKIIAHVDDIKFAKKRMISRTARYTGLLDKLDFIEPASDESSVPTVEQLVDVSSWVVHVTGGDLTVLAAIAAAAEASPSVKNVSILMSGAQKVGDDALKEAEQLLKSKATTFAYTMVAVGEWNEEPEASCAYVIKNVTDVVEGGGALIGGSETFSREESLRLVTECLALDKAAGLCVVANPAKNTTDLEGTLIRGMRERGYTRPQEIEYMVYKGVKGYYDMVETEKAKNIKKPMTEKEEAEQKAIEAKAREKRMKEAEELKSKKYLEPMAEEWAEKQWKRQQYLKNMRMRKEKFIPTIWDRAMLEASIQYRKDRGQEVDEDKERAEFKEKMASNLEEKRSAAKDMFSGLDFDTVISRPRKTERSENAAIKRKMRLAEAEKEEMERMLEGQ